MEREHQKQLAKLKESEEQNEEGTAQEEGEQEGEEEGKEEEEVSQSGGEDGEEEEKETDGENENDGSATLNIENGCCITRMKCACCYGTNWLSLQVMGFEIWWISGFRTGWEFDYIKRGVYGKLWFH